MARTVWLLSRVLMDATLPPACFTHRGRCIPKRQYTLEELKLNGIRAEQLLSPEDTSLNSARNAGRALAVTGLAAAAWLNHWDLSNVLLAVAAATFVLGADQVRLPTRRVLTLVLVTMHGEPAACSNPCVPP